MAIARANGPRSAEACSGAAATSTVSPSAAVNLAIAGSSPRRCSFLRSSGSAARGVASLTQSSSSLPRRRTSSPREDVGDPDCVTAGPALLPGPADAYRNVAVPLAQPPIVEKQHEDADGAEPEGYPERCEDCPDHDRSPLWSSRRLRRAWEHRATVPPEICDSHRPDGMVPQTERRSRSHRARWDSRLRQPRGSRGCLAGSCHRDDDGRLWPLQDVTCDVGGRDLA